MPVAEARVGNDSSNETNVDILESVRGKDVFIIQTGYRYTWIEIDFQLHLQFPFGQNDMEALLNWKWSWKSVSILLSSTV